MNDKSRNIRSMKQKIYKDTDKKLEEIESLQRDILAAAVSDVVEEDLSIPFPASGGLPRLMEGDFYHIRDENTEGVFFLENISRGKATIFIFSNVVTKSRTTYTSVSIMDLANGGNSAISRVEANFVEKYKKNYWGGHVDKILSALPTSKTSKKKR